jgi:hypothetical protein
MKRQSKILRGMILSISVALAIGMAHAQIGGDVLSAKIPFNFSVGMKTFPAGEYSLTPLHQHTMLLRNETGQILTIVATNSVESSAIQKSAKLVFYGYGGQYFLASIWKSGESTGQELVKSPSEIEMARTYPSGQQVALQIAAHR